MTLSRRSFTYYNVGVIEEALGETTGEAMLYLSSDKRSALSTSTSGILGVGAERGIQCVSVAATTSRRSLELGRETRVSQMRHGYPRRQHTSDQPSDGHGVENSCEPPTTGGEGSEYRESDTDP